MQEENRVCPEVFALLWKSDRTAYLESEGRSQVTLWKFRFNSYTLDALIRCPSLSGLDLQEHQKND
jgi:hypothetical protein